MSLWPVPQSYSKTIPKSGSPGSFWEHRGDRFHAGVDLYAPEGSNVLSIDEGRVIDCGLFTSPYDKSYWNETFFVLIMNKDGKYYKYAELGSIQVQINQEVEASQIIGTVGMVLNIDKITGDSPGYIQKIKHTGHVSMLHFEMYTSKPTKNKQYFGGNWFLSSKPDYLEDPTNYLEKC
jgi:murein DD-endopeptidase MepM/ murein hydrolase activator NlpD